MNTGAGCEDGGFGLLLRLLLYEGKRRCGRQQMTAPVLMNAAPAPEPAAATGEAVAAVRTDRELASAVLSGDRKAAAVFVQRFADPVFRYVASRLAPRVELADDIVQDVFVAAWQRLGSYSGSAALEGWLLGIARHKVEDHYRERLRRWEDWESTEAETASDSGSELDLRIDRERLAEKSARVLRLLPEHYATILLWRYWERRSARQIAAETGRTEKAVERLLARAREQFKSRWMDV